jgi:hypothetical protein
MVENNAGSYKFAFSNTFDLKVFNALHQIKSNAIRLDGVPLRFLKFIFPQVLSIVTHFFNTILTISFYAAACTTLKVMPIAKRKRTKQYVGL